MEILRTALEGVLIFEADRYADERGWFMELSNDRRFREYGLDLPLVQTNLSFSKRGVLRGMHYQSPNEQGKLVSVPAGSIYDVAADLRRGSPSFGQWFGCELSSENARQLWIPEGFAHGFLVLSETALVHYGCTAPYDSTADRSVIWNDPVLGIEWPSTPALISAKDRTAPRLSEIDPGQLPQYQRQD